MDPRYRCSHRAIYLSFSVLCGLSSLIAAGRIEAEELTPSREYQIKASLIFNFLQFVEWPPASDGRPVSTLRVCIAGKDPFGIALTRFTREKANEKRIEVSLLPQPDLNALERCSVVFFGSSPGFEAEQTVAALRSHSVLTVGETPDFIDKGGIISLVLDDEKIVFDVNRLAAQNAGLGLSSKLLRFARKVKE